VISRTVEAVLFDWSRATPLGGRQIARLRRRVEAACAVGVHVAVLGVFDVADVDDRLRARPAGPGRLWLCSDGDGLFDVGVTGPRRMRRHDARSVGNDGVTTDELDAVRTVLARLGREGVGAGLVLVAGVAGSRVPDDVVRAASDAPIVALFDEQLRRRRARRVPAIDLDPAWVVRETGRDPLRHRITETLFTVGASGLATRGSLEEPNPESVPLLLAAGVYVGSGAGQALLPGPGWTGLLIEPPPGEDERILDLRTGVLLREELAADGAPVRTLRFASAATPGVVALRAEGQTGRVRAGNPFSRAAGTNTIRGRLGSRFWAKADATGSGGIAAVAVQRTGRDGSVRTIERLAAYVADEHRPASVGIAATLADAAAEIGFDRLLGEHRAAWARRWDAVDVHIEDDPATQLAVRYALFQLWCNVNRHDELAVGARGLSGNGYSGHVFWDADVFVLPAMLSIDPPAARAMIRYRLHRLAAAQERALAEGRRGARFPWESASTGEEVTPTAGGLGGSLMPILTGKREEHVTADVAWAAARYADWVGLGDANRPELPLLLETARYWASRCRRDADGSAHIEQVIGPDEYHECVDDNAYTNGMARWNLRAAADAARRAGIVNEEANQWRQLADRIVEGYDATTGRYEQFAGYYKLEPLLIADFAQPPVAADLLLGRERVAGSQLIKQPDVLMLHHVIPDDVQADSLVPNLDFYEPRTAHGSSLSPAVTASLFARAGRPDEALAMLAQALTLDLGDTTGMTAAGLHLANLGGVWQALVGGFAGLTVRHGGLVLDPRLPSSWGSLELRLHALRRKVRLSVTRDEVTIHTDGPLRVHLTGHDPRTVCGTATLGEPTCESKAVQ
jgi:trehalose/maltose hydrolase-like predicted phosphorylase